MIKSDAWEWFRWGIQATSEPYDKEKAIIEFDKAWISVNGLACMLVGCKNPAKHTITDGETLTEIHICEEHMKMIEGRK